MSTGLGPLVAADELLDHQIVDTFATVAVGDQAWTEKVWASASAQDGSVSIGFGLGKYTNRGVMDAAGAVSRGREQWTVRASRSIGRLPDLLSVGPLHYEVTEPLVSVRFRLEPNQVLPISFDCTFSGVVPPFVEAREMSRSLGGARVDSNTARFHQSGTAHGWVEVDGKRVEMDPSTWLSTRDRSWGLRRGVGPPVPGLRTRSEPSGLTGVVLWCPVACRRPDGSSYGLHWYYRSFGVGEHSRVEIEGAVEHPDGTRDEFGAIVPHLEVDDITRRFRGGRLDVTMVDGTPRPLILTAIGDSGVHLGPALYFGFDGHFHGEWRGSLHIDGEHIPDCTDPAVVHRLHQLRDCIVRVDDPVDGGVGWGHLQSIITGADKGMGLTDPASFL
ncbi:MAG: hypothetical protein ACYCVN_06265 [Acidimicrobiales bacterium]